MKDLLQWIDENGGVLQTMFEIGVGLFLVIMLCRCALT
jgi:hypothetical protein